MDKYIDILLEELQLSLRSYNCLKRANINTLYELINMSDAEIVKIRNLGRRCSEEVLKYKHDVLSGEEPLYRDIGVTLKFENRFNQDGRRLFPLFSERETISEDYDFKPLRDYCLKKMNLSEAEIKFLCLRTQKSLEEMAIILNITREKVRLLESKIFRKINSNLKFEIYIPPFNLNKVYYREDMSLEDRFFICSFSSSIVYKFHQLIVPYHAYIPKIIDNKIIGISHHYIYIPRKIINKVLEFIKEHIFELYDKGFIECNEDFELSHDEISYICDYLGFVLHKNYIINRIVKWEQIKFALRNLNRSIHLSSESDKNELVRFAIEHFGYEYLNHRSFENSIVKFAVRESKGVYSFKNIPKHIDKRVFTRVIRYINGLFEINNEVRLCDVYYEYRNLFHEHNIDDANSLIDYLTCNYPGKYIIDKERLIMKKGE